MMKKSPCRVNGSQPPNFQNLLCQHKISPSPPPPPGPGAPLTLPAWRSLNWKWHLRNDHLSCLQIDNWTNNANNIHLKCLIWCLQYYNKVIAYHDKFPPCQYYEHCVNLSPANFHNTDDNDDGVGVWVCYLNSPIFVFKIDYVSLNCLHDKMHRTRNRMRVAIESRKGMKVKVLK